MTPKQEANGCSLKHRDRHPASSLHRSLNMYLLTPLSLWLACCWHWGHGGKQDRPRPRPPGANILAGEGHDVTSWQVHRTERRRICEENDGVGAVSNGRGWRPIAPQSGRRRRPAESEGTGPGADMSLAFPRAAKKDSVAKTESTGPRVVSEKIGRVDRDQVNG